MKHFDFKVDPVTGEEFYEVFCRGQALLSDPHLNKGTCFDREERLNLDLLGLLPYGVSDMQTQVARCLEAYRRKTEDMERYIYLLELLNRNETLFYAPLTQNLAEMVPIVYTPTVGTACQQMSHIQRRARGLYIHPDNVGHIDQIFQSVASPDVRLIVVTDGERILGLGDLGADGMGIPVGKVALYIAAGGLHPATCLPMCIDVGTNNQKMLEDPLYMGYRHPRLTGQAYDEFMEKFVLGVKRNFPQALLQWEDFAQHNAFRLLERYRNRLLSFNDDIQGTGSVAAAALMTATRIKQCRMLDLRVVIVGMGEAGRGIADSIRAVMTEEGATTDEVRKRIYAIEAKGLLVEGDPGMTDQQREYATPRGVVVEWKLDDPNRIGLMDALRNAKPNVLIGVTARTQLFNEDVLKAMAAYDDIPVIMPLSNPTSRAECTPEDVARAVPGRFLMATGSPFKPLERDGL
jgi:malate dehydrogenase (oxaloacetate-decarboxylating)